MTISATEFFVTPGPIDPFDGAFLVTVLVDAAPGPNDPIRAWVGTQELELVTHSPLGNGFSGQVTNQPAATDTLSVEIGDQGRVDTALTATSNDELDDPGGNV